VSLKSYESSDTHVISKFGPVAMSLEEKAKSWAVDKLEPNFHDNLMKLRNISPRYEMTIHPDATISANVNLGGIQFASAHHVSLKNAKREAEIKILQHHFRDDWEGTRIMHVLAQGMTKKICFLSHYRLPSNYLQFFSLHVRHLKRDAQPREMGFSVEKEPKRRMPTDSESPMAVTALHGTAYGKAHAPEEASENMDIAESKEKDPKRRRPTDSDSPMAVTALHGIKAFEKAHAPEEACEDIDKSSQIRAPAEATGKCQNSDQP
jgi:hypothetical protein